MSDAADSFQLAWKLSQQPGYSGVVHVENIDGELVYKAITNEDYYQPPCLFDGYDDWNSTNLSCPCPKCSPR